MLVPFEPLKDPSKTLARGDKKEVFLVHLSATGSVRDAVAVIGLKPATVYAWRTDPAFAKRWDEVIHGGIRPVLEDEAIRRALAGSDALLMFLLKSMDRKRYDDAVARVSNETPGVAITITDAKKKTA